MTKKMIMRINNNNKNIHLKSLHIIPSRYQSKIILNTKTVNEEQVYVFGLNIDQVITKNGKLFVNGSVDLEDGSEFKLTIIHSIKLKGLFYKNKCILLEGMINSKNTCFFPTILKSLQTGIIPVYSSKNRLFERDVLKEIDLVEDLTIRESLRKVHFPNSLKEAQEGMNNLFYLELAVFLHLLEKTKKTRESYKKNMKIKLPFALTEDQKKVVKEIHDDMESDRRFVRIVYGDVGCGKTIVGLLAAIKMVANKKQVVILAPTSILALQIYGVFGEILPPEIKISLVTAKVNKKSIDEDTDIFIGTHALLHRDCIKNLGLLIIDEQHRFGVNQRNQLVEENNADVIMMTATPIPRTFQMLSSGYIGVSTLEQKPMSGDKQTVVLHIRRRDEVLSRICELSKHEKIIWVLRSIEKAEEMYHTLSKKFDVFLVHSKIKEKENLLQYFSNLKNGLLISTTVVEVGIDIEVNYIVIEDADMFGFSQLHQLRGRVGRRDKTGFCLLLGSNIAKLNKIKNASTGFEIAQADYENRGGGKICGTEQSGSQSFKFLISVSNKNELRIITEKDILLAKKVKINEQLIDMFADIEEISL